MQIRDYFVLLLRAFLFALFVAAISLAAEWMFVAVMALSRGVPFTSFMALGFFSASMGWIAAYPSPSRISLKPIRLAGRCLLVIETAVLVAVAMFASSRFMAYRHIYFPIEVRFAAYVFGLFFGVSLLYNFRRLRHESFGPR